MFLGMDAPTWIAGLIGAFAVWCILYADYKKGKGE